MFQIRNARAAGETGVASRLVSRVIASFDETHASEKGQHVGDSILTVSLETGERRHVSIDERRPLLKTVDRASRIEQVIGDVVVDPGVVSVQSEDHAVANVF